MAKIKDGARRKSVWIVIAAVLMLAVATLASSPVAGARSDRRVATAHGTNGKAITSASARKNAPTPVMYRVGHAAGEPTFGFTKNGDLFYMAGDGCATSCAGSDQMLDNPTPGSHAVFRSSDNGKKWTDVSPVVGPLYHHAFSLDPYVYVDEDTSRVFTIDLYVACSELSFTDDGGETWLTNPVNCGEPVNDHQTIFAGPPTQGTTMLGDYPNVVYYCFNHPALTKCTKSLDGGITWITSADTQGPDCGGLNGHGITDKEGTVYLPLGANCGQPILAISHDETSSWETVRVAPMGAADQDPSVAIDKQGNLYYLFVSNKDRLPYLVISRDGGKKWSEPTMVGAPGVVDVNLATLDVGDPGKVAIAYYGTTGGKPQTWNGYLTVGKNVLDGKPFFYTGSVNDPSQPLKVDECGPGRCGRVLDFIDVEISPSGQAFGAYVDACMEVCEDTGEEQITDNDGVVGTLLGAFKLK